MAEPTPTPTDPKPGQQPSGEGNPTPTPTPSGSEPGKKPSEGNNFDPTKITDEDFNKLFEDNRLYRHPRFKSLSERAKKADELEKQQQEAEAKRLQDEGKWKELAEKNAAEAEAANKRVEEIAVKSAIQAEAAKLGIVDVEAAAVLVDRANIKVNDDGSVSGAEEALKALVEAKPYLKGNNQPNPVGSGSNPSAGQTENGTKKFFLSQIQDHKFFSENEKEIMEAMKLGLIEDDVNK